MKINLFSVALLLASSILPSCNHRTIKVSSVKTSATKPVKTSPTTTVMPAGSVTISEEILDERVKFISGDDLDAALALAKAEKKPVFLDFYADWCAPCKVMDDGVFHDYDVADFMNKNVINLKIHIEKGRGAAIKQKLFVTPLPTVIFLDPDGKEISRKEGIPLIADFKKMMKAATWKVKNPSGQP
jgi:thiol:disulfide interchange protein